MKAGAVSKFIEQELPALCRAETSSEAGYALPPGSLAVLRGCVERLGVRRVFEFGTGQSTHLFLAAGCTVTAVEDSAVWLAETEGKMDAMARERFTPHLLPQQRIWHRGTPVQSWALPTAAMDSLRVADLVLVDSPALPPSREHALTISLAEAREALVVVDDVNIPTVTRFCRRLAERNGAAHFQTPLDHGLFFCGPATRVPLDDKRSVLETLKAWRRYFHPRGGA